MLYFIQFFIDNFKPKKVLNIFSVGVKASILKIFYNGKDQFSTLFLFFREMFRFKGVKQHYRKSTDVSFPVFVYKSPYLRIKEFLSKF
jgi:hypothetical protein